VLGECPRLCATSVGSGRAGAASSFTAGPRGAGGWLPRHFRNAGDKVTCSRNDVERDRAGVASFLALCTSSGERIGGAGSARVGQCAWAITKSHRWTNASPAQKR